MSSDARHRRFENTDLHAQQSHAMQECPRCGYNLAGTIRSWKDSCQLTGACSECGLEFACGDLLNPRLSVPRWSVEGGRLRSVPWRGMRTLIRMLRPWSFWSQLKLQHRIRWGRIVVALALLAPLLLLQIRLSMAWTTYRKASELTVSGRILTHSPLILAFKSVVVPESTIRTSAGAHYYTYRDYGFDMPDVGWRAAYYCRRESFLPVDGPRVIEERGFVSWLVVWCAPVGFALLPISRRIARVRWRHILRIWLYSLALLAIPIAFDIYEQVGGGIPWRWRGESALAMMMIVGAAAVMWWACATRFYLRMKHGWAIGLFVVGFAYLAQIVIFESMDFIRAMLL